MLDLEGKETITCLEDLEKDTPFTNYEEYRLMQIGLVADDIVDNYCINAR